MATDNYVIFRVTNKQLRGFHSRCKISITSVVLHSELGLALYRKTMPISKNTCCHVMKNQDEDLSIII